MPDFEKFECPYCTHSLNPTEIKDGVMFCPWCGHSFTAVKPDSKAAGFVAMGEHDLDTARFNDAYEAFEKAAELDPTEPEAYFGMALAEFNVRYLKAVTEKDGETKTERQPIVYKTSAEKFEDNKNAKKAFELASKEQCPIYVSRAEEIDYINGEFKRLEDSGLKYDCFICVKVTDDETEERTADYKYADDVYFELRGKGYKPFFSERETGDKTGRDYEALILYALYKSECMLVICSDESYLYTPWVKNEYTRFLRLIGDEEKESDSIAVAYKGKPIQKLPERRGGKCQGIDLGALNAYDRIVTFVENHTPEAKRRREEERQKAIKEEENRRAEQEQLKRQIEEQRKLIEELRKQNSSPFSSPEELLEMLDRAREERDRKLNENRTAKTEKTAARETVKSRSVKVETKTVAAESKSEIAAGKLETQNSAVNSDFTIRDGVLVKYKGNSLEVALPCGVSEIGKHAFYRNETVKSINIPDGVRVIGNGAFNGCKNLMKITLPDSIENIGVYAFTNCISLGRVKLPGGLKKIGIYAFANCISLGGVNLPGGIKKIGSGTFAYCASLKSIKLPASVESVGTEAFRGSGLTEIALPDGISVVGNYAFTSCAWLESLTVPKSVTQLGFGAFSDCKSLKSVTIPARFENDIKSYFGDTSAEFTFIGDGPEENSETPDEIGTKSEKPEFAIENGTLVKYNGNSRKVQIPFGIIRIGKNAFENCERIESVVIPEGVVEIATQAFTNSMCDKSCTELTEISLPKSLTRIGAGAFYGCSELKSITIPENVTEIGDNAFGGCRNLESITVSENNKKYKSIDNCLLCKIESSKKYMSLLLACKTSKIPPCVLTVEPYAFSSGGPMHVELPSSVRYLNSSLYTPNLSNIESVSVDENNRYFKSENNCLLSKNGTFLYLCRNADGSFPPKVKCVSSTAFSGFAGLKSVSLSKAFEKIESNAFFNCVGLETVIMSDRVKSIGAHAFYDCRSLKTLIIGENVTYIGFGAFKNCKSLTYLEIPDSVTDIDSNAFENCENLEKLIIGKNVRRIDAVAFAYCRKLKKLVLPDNVGIGGNLQFGNCDGLTEVIMPKRLEVYKERIFGKTKAKFYFT